MKFNFTLFTIALAMTSFLAIDSAGQDRPLMTKSEHEQQDSLDALRKHDSIQQQKAKDRAALSDANASRKDTKAKAKEAHRVESEANDAARESKNAYRMEKRAQKARKQADKQEEKAVRAREKSRKN